MTNLVSVTAVATCALLLLTAQLPAADAPAPLDSAIRAVGAATVSRLTVTGFGSVRSMGEAPSREGARRIARRYRLTADFASGRGTVDAQLVGESTGSHADDELAWSTPHGFLRIAAVHPSVGRATPSGLELSYDLDGRRVTGTIASDGVVDRVRALVGRAEGGFVEVETFFRDYEWHGSVRFPRHITRYRDGVLALDLWVSSVQATTAQRRLRFVSHAD